MTNDKFSHLNALNFRLHNEEQRLKQAKTEKERQMRQVWVDGIKKEISAEYKFLGMKEPKPMTLDDVFADEMFNELFNA